MRTFLSRIGGYFAALALSTILTLTSIPIVIAAAGTDAWAGLVTGQAVGIFGGAVALFGWGVIGPATVAALPRDERPRYFEESLQTRTLLAVGVAPVVALVVLAISPAHTNQTANVIASATPLVNALGAAWFFAGAAQPGRLVTLDALPRLVLTVPGLILLVATQHLAWFVCFQLLAEAASTTLAAMVIRQDGRAITSTRRPTSHIERLRANSAGTTAALAATIYLQLPMVVLTALYPGPVASFAMMDRLKSYCYKVMSPIFQIAQGTIPRADSHDGLLQNVRRAALAAIGLGPACGVIFTLLSPEIARLLSGGAIKPSLELTIPFGVTFSMIVVNAITGMSCLVALHRQRSLAASVVAGSAVGVALVAAAALFRGPASVAWGVASAESVIAIWQLAVIRHDLREPRTCASGPTAAAAKIESRRIV